MSKLKDNEILDFLMTSDFDENLKDEEYKFLLLKWRKFYRAFNGRYSSRVDELNSINYNLKQDLIKLENVLSGKNKEVDRLKSDLDSIKNRKLTIKERLLGKIIL